MKRKLGVIGGLGTDTAAQFYVDAERLWNATGETSHIPLVIENIQSPFDLEQSLTQEMDRVGELCEFLCTAAENLQRSGSSLLVLPCNTAHVHIEAVRQSVHVPMLSITEEVAKKLAAHGVTATAILGTRVTRETGIYDSVCREHGIETHYPTEDDQLIVERIIQRALSWTNDQSDQDDLLAVISRCQQAGAEGVVLACTDLQLCMPKALVKGVFDSMRTLAEASVEVLRRQK
jgi:aspartate racemase